jgi:hypothetical protein
VKRSLFSDSTCSGPRSSSSGCVARASALLRAGVSTPSFHAKNTQHIGKSQSKRPHNFMPHYFMPRTRST